MGHDLDLGLCRVSLELLIACGFRIMRALAQGSCLTMGKKKICESLTRSHGIRAELAAEKLGFVGKEFAAADGICCAAFFQRHGSLPDPTSEIWVSKASRGSNVQILFRVSLGCGQDNGIL